jgi:hypothetical protein
MSGDARLEFTGQLLSELVALARPEHRGVAGTLAVAVGHKVDALLEDTRAEAVAETAHAWEAVVEAKVALVMAEREAERSLAVLAETFSNATGCVMH